MILDRLTISGADSSVGIDLMNFVSLRYPFVEWGILFSRSRQGTPRYPGMAWIDTLINDRLDTTKLSAHYCGDMCRELLETGGKSFLTPVWFGDTVLRHHFSRLQLNYHYSSIPIVTTLIGGLAAELVNNVPHLPHVDVILQITNSDILNLVDHISSTNIHHLYDSSRGQGISPESFPQLDPSKHSAYRYVGFAGGINPDNIEATLTELTSRSGDKKFYIDLESGIRTNNQFDVKKLLKILEITEEFV